MNEILDFHNHIFPENVAQKVIDSLQKEMGFTPYGAGTVTGLKKEMEHSGVKVCLTLSVAVSPSLVETTNRWLLSQKEDGFIPIGSIHPLFEDYKSEVKHLKEAGMKGIKFHSLFQQIRPDDERIFHVYEEIINQGMFFIFHSGPGMRTKPGEEILATPERIKRLLDIFPKMTMVVAHFGGFHMFEEAKKHLLGKNVYMDTSYPPGLCFQPPEWVLEMIHGHNPDRILFGTDTPFARQKEDAEYILRLPISEDLKEKILWKNGRRLLGLPEA
jgi:predicted TIM-barrel fold metal-dependent hydrolase